MVEQRLNDIVQSIASAFGASATLTYRRVYPATVNTPGEAQLAGDVASALLGEDNVIRDLEPSMGSEDFSFMLKARPGAYLRLGQGGAENGCFLHNTRYDFNDHVIPVGSGLFAGIAERSLPL
jgi:hippurate hydrolase